jgi:hypothetical protein
VHSIIIDAVVLHVADCATIASDNGDDSGNEASGGSNSEDDDEDFIHRAKKSRSSVVSKAKPAPRLAKKLPLHHTGDSDDNSNWGSDSDSDSDNDDDDPFKF